MSSNQKRCYISKCIRFAIHQQLLDAILYSKTSEFKFQDNYGNFSGVQIHVQSQKFDQIVFVQAHHRVCGAQGLLFS